jgi:hypothetical protein
MRQDEGKVLKEQAYSGRIETSPLNPGECENKELGGSDRFEGDPIP